MQRRSDRGAFPAPPIADESVSEPFPSTVPEPAHPSRRRGVHRFTVILLAAVVVGGLSVALDPTPVAAGRQPRAVIVLGPSGERMHENREQAELLARQATRAGMRVTRVFHPRATWERVRTQTRGANLVIYLGHGNGWPSPYGPFQEATKDGFGLNPREGASAWTTDWHGGNQIRQELRLASNAVVILYYACYSAGNSEPGRSTPSLKVATRRVDNYAAAFLDEKVGASAVFAFWTTQSLNIPRRLMGKGHTMDDVFQTPGPFEGSAGGWVGRHDTYHPSARTRFRRIHLDPHPNWGYVRAVAGKLQMTTNEWLGLAPPR
ncbi:hypothetical protein BH18CHL1_BH18CHL1_06330 [soil metagenome]